MRCSVPKYWRAWIDRKNIAENRARLARESVLPLLPVFRVLDPDGREAPARRVSWSGFSRLVYDPSRPDMRDRASAWIEFRGPAMVDDVLVDDARVPLLDRAITD